MKKTHRQSARTPSPKAKRHFSLVKHPFLVLAGTWVLFALIAAVSTEILVHPTGERRITVESTDLQAPKREFDFPIALYGAIALICSGGSIVVYRRYRQKVAGATIAIAPPTKAKARNRRAPRPQPVALEPEAPQPTYSAPPQKNVAAPKKRSRRRKPEVLPMTSDGYAPQPSPPQSKASRSKPEVTVMPYRCSQANIANILVKSMDLREHQSLDSLLRDRPKGTGQTDGTKRDRHSS